MDAPRLDATINSYKEKIKKLDAMASKLPDEQKRRFKAEKKRFEQRLKVWQQTLGLDLVVFNNNVSEGYHELEAYLSIMEYKKQTK